MSNKLIDHGCWPDTLWNAGRMADADADSHLWCSDSNGMINVLELAKKIEGLR